MSASRFTRSCSKIGRDKMSGAYKHKQWPSKQLTITNLLIFEKPLFLVAPLDVIAVPFEPCGSDHMILKTYNCSRNPTVISK